MSESSLTASSRTTVSHRCARRSVKEGLYRPAATWEALWRTDKPCRDMLACKASADASKKDGKDLQLHGRHYGEQTSPVETCLHAKPLQMLQRRTV